jgi:hypothetical protein
MKCKYVVREVTVAGDHAHLALSNLLTCFVRGLKRSELGTVQLSVEQFGLVLCETQLTF